MSAESAAADRSAIVRELAQKLRQAERSRQLNSASFADVDTFADRKRAASISTGIEPLDQLLPDGGFLKGTIVEWVCDEIGSGALTLAMLSAARILRHQMAATGSHGTPGVMGAGGVGQNLVVIDAAEDFYPVAAAGLGIDLNRTVVVRPGSDGVSGGGGNSGVGGVRSPAFDKSRASRNGRTSHNGGASRNGQASHNSRPPRHNDVLWALEQVLRSKAVGLTLCAIDHLNGHTFRRLQLAAEAGGGVCFLRRPPAAIRQPTWADVRLLVTRDGRFETHAVRRLTVELLKCRSGLTGGRVELDYHDETNDVRVAAKLARPAAAQHSARA